MSYTSDIQKKIYSKLLIVFYVIVAIVLVMYFSNSIKSKRSFYIDKKEVKLSLGNNYQVMLKVDNKPYINDGAVTWESSDNSIAIVDQNGVVTGLGTGSVEITARSEDGKISTAYVEVYGVEESKTTISLNETEIELDIGSSFELKTDIETNNPNNTIVTWLSNNDSIASVNNGIVTANKSGKAVIIAKLEDGSNASCTVKVREEKQDLSTITIANSDIKAKIGDSITITPTIYDPNNEITSLKWISSNNGIATVNNAGMVTILDEGNVNITVLANNGKSATASITVSGSGVSASNISLDKTNLELSIGSTYTLDYHIEPENADKIVIWSSNNKSVATVDNGIVTAKNTGSALISAVLKNGKIATCMVTVVSNNNGLTIDKSFLDLKINQSEKLNVTGNNITWSSSDPNVATVDQDGNVKGINIGTATIIAKNNEGKQVTCAVEVKNNTAYKDVIVLDTETKDLKVGEEFTLIATSIPQNKAIENIIWSSSDEKVAVVNNGVVTAKAEGTAIIKAIGNNNSASCTVKVTSDYVEIVSISLDTNKINVDVGSSMLVNVVFNPVNATNRNITWTSSDNEIVRIVNGVIYGNKEGNATIVATASNGMKAQAYVTVNSQNTIKPESINLSQKDLTMYLGESVNLSAAISPANATNQEITWSTSDNNIASVDNGYVVAKKAGSVTITATTSNGKKDTCTILVRNSNIDVQSIFMNSNETMNAGESLTLTAKVLPATATNKTITWTSSDATTATIDQNGTVKALKAGSVIITAKSNNNITAVCKITIMDKPINITSISLNQTNTNMNVGNTLALSVTFNPANATNKNITWTSSNNNIATVNNGVVTAKAAGNVTITATSNNGKTATCNIVINNNIVDVSSISLDKTNTSMNIGNNLTLNANIQPSNATNKNITWTSSNNNIATVNNGIVTAKAAGNVVITATTSNGKQATCAITVNSNIVNATGVSLNTTDISMNTGNNITLVATVAPTNTTNKNITWTSSNNNIATVDKNGNVKAKANGTATITATTSNGKQATCKVTVTTKAINVSSISLNKTKESLYVGNSTTLTATIKPANASSKNITWSSNNTAVATVDKNGNVKALKVGSATITATASNGMKATCVITVISNNVDVTGISISNNQIALGVGKQSTVLATISPANATNKNISWSTSDGSIVSVDQKGNIKGLKTGTATITAKSNNGKTAQATVNVTTGGVTVIDSTYTTIIANFNVKDYGAKGDGVTDDTQAFKNAIADANNCRNQPSCNGYTIYVPKGKYVITDSLDLGPAVGLVGELKEGTTDGTILVIKFGAGTDDINKSAIKMNTQSYVANMAFWYPNQNANANGYTVVYPPTILHTGHYSISLNNLNFINSFVAMDFASHHFDESLQHVSNIYGSPYRGLISDGNFDTIRITNMNFDPKYWLESGMTGIPSGDNVRVALKNHGEGLILERIDWFFLAGVRVFGYNVGIHLRASVHQTKNRTDQPVKTPDGEMYDVQLTNCHYAIYAQDTRPFTVTLGTLQGNHPNIAALHIDNSSFISLNSVTIEGTKAIVNKGPGAISTTNSVIKGAIERSNPDAKISFTNDSLTNTGFDGSQTNDSIAKGPNVVDYNKRVVTKPKSTKIITINAAKGSDITSQVKDAINSLKSTGGIVYIPAGNYVISDHIDVYSGIEIRGTTPWFHDWIQNYNGNWYEYSTRIATSYKNDVLFTLYSNSGLNGFSILYDNPNLTEYPFTIRGNGSNIYEYCNAKLMARNRLSNI